MAHAHISMTKVAATEARWTSGGKKESTCQAKLVGSGWVA